MTSPLELLTGVSRLLEELRIPYHVGGSIASSWYAKPRTTADLDLVIAPDISSLESLVRELARDYYVSRPAALEALEKRGTFNAIRLDSSFKIDFFILGSRAFDQEEFRRAVRRPIGGEGGAQVRLKSAEDLVLRKLEWFRLGGETSDRQWRDVVEILVAMRGRLDDVYLDRWAAELGLTNLLSRARADAAESV